MVGNSGIQQTLSIKACTSNGCLGIDRDVELTESAGIGAATCENLASKGASLLMNYTSESSTEKCQKLAEQLQADHDVNCLPVQADMGTENGPSHIVNMALNHFAHPKSRKLQIDM